MSKASRKVNRYTDKQKDVITEAEIKEQFGKMSITGKILTGIAFMHWMDLTPVNILIMLAVYIGVTVSVEPFLMARTTMASAMAIAHGLVTSTIIVLIFSFIRKKNPDQKTTLEEVLYRIGSIGVVLAILSYVTAKFM